MKNLTVLCPLNGTAVRKGLNRVLAIFLEQVLVFGFFGGLFVKMLKVEKEPRKKKGIERPWKGFHGGRNKGEVMWMMRDMWSRKLLIITCEGLQRQPGEDGAGDRL